MALAGAARGLCGRLAYGGAARWPNYYALGTCDSLQGVLVSGGARGAKTETKAEKKAKAVQKDEQQSSSLGGKVQQMMKVGSLAGQAWLRIKTDPCALPAASLTFVPRWWRNTFVGARAAKGAAGQAVGGGP
jgi:hypothetical protein